MANPISRTWNITDEQLLHACAVPLLTVVQREQHLTSGSLFTPKPQERSEARRAHIQAVAHKLATTGSVEESVRALLHHVRRACQAEQGSLYILDWSSHTAK